MTSNRDDFASSLAAAFATPAVQKSLKSAMNIKEEIRPFFNELEGKITTLDNNLKEYKATTDKKIDDFESRLAKIEERAVETAAPISAPIIEELNQTRRNTTLIFTGLKGSNLKREICNVAANYLGVEMGETSISSVIKIITKDKTKIMHKVQFNHMEERNEIYRNRMMLRDNVELFINEDLIQCRNKIAYRARKLAQNGDIFRAWTYEGKVYIRETEDMTTPKRIEKLEELPPLTEPKTQMVASNPM